MAPRNLEAQWDKWLQQHACPHNAQLTTRGGKSNLREHHFMWRRPNQGVKREAALWVKRGFFTMDKLVRRLDSHPWVRTESIWYLWAPCSKTNSIRSARPSEIPNLILYASRNPASQKFCVRAWVLKSFNQGSTLPADLTENSYGKHRGSYRVFFHTRLCVCVSGGRYFCFFVDVGRLGSNFGGQFGVWEHREAPKGHAMDPKMPAGRDLENFGTFPRRKASPLLVHFSFFCVFLSLFQY